MPLVYLAMFVFAAMFPNGFTIAYATTSYHVIFTLPQFNKQLL